jgi:hypothetical protein
MAPLMPQATSLTTQPMLLAPNQTSQQTQDKSSGLNLHRHKLTTLKVVSVDAYETRWK